MRILQCLGFSVLLLACGGGGRACPDITTVGPTVDLADGVTSFSVGTACTATCTMQATDSICAEYIVEPSRPAYLAPSSGVQCDVYAVFKDRAGFHATLTFSRATGECASGYTSVPSHLTVTHP
jgi:hypothetical protein